MRTFSNALISTICIIGRALTSINRDYRVGLFSSLFSNFSLDKLKVAQTLVIYTALEQLVEVKAVLDKEADVATLHLHGLVSKNI